MKTHIFLLNEPLGEFSRKMSPDFHRQFISSFRMTTSIRYHSRCYLVFVLKNSQLNFRDCLIIQLSMFLLSDFCSQQQLFYHTTFKPFCQELFYFILLFRRFSFAESAFLFYHLNFLLSRSFFDFFIFLCCPYRSRRQLSYNIICMTPCQQVF